MGSRWEDQLLIGRGFSRIITVNGRGEVRMGKIGTFEQQRFGGKLRQCVSEAGLTAIVQPGYSASGSCGFEADTQKIRAGFAVLEAVGHDAQGKRLGLGSGIRRAFTVGEDARQFRDFRDPAAILFLLEFNTEGYHRAILLRVTWIVRTRLLFRP